MIASHKFDLLDSLNIFEDLVSSLYIFKYENIIDENILNIFIPGACLFVCFAYFQIDINKSFNIMLNLKVKI